MPPLPLPLAGRRLVVVEDRPAGQRAYAEALREAGAFVLATDRADAAGEPVPRVSPADAVVVVADRIEHGDLDAMRALRDDGFEGLIVIALGDWSREAASEWAQFGADDCLPRPTDPTELPCHIADYLARSRNAALEIASPLGPVSPEPPRPRREAAFTTR